MPEPDRMIAFFLAALVIIVIPGPSVLFVVGRALSHGRAVALASVIGNGIGCLVVLVLVAFGLGTIVQSSRVAFVVLQVVGAGYLVWLGIQAIRHRDALDPKVIAASDGGPLGIVGAGRQGVVVGLTNPKVYVMLAALLPQFISPERGSAQLQILVLGVTITLIGIVSDSAWALAAAQLRRVLTRTPERGRAVVAGGGVLMIGLGIWLVATGLRH